MENLKNSLIPTLEVFRKNYLSWCWVPEKTLQAIGLKGVKWKEMNHAFKKNQKL